MGNDAMIENEEDDKREPSAETVPEIPPGGLLDHPDPTHEDANPPRGNRFPVVGVGASAGGLEAFTQLLRALPDDTGMAFVLVQHLDPSHESLLPGLLSHATRMPVIVVEDGMRLEPNQVYIIPPNASMVIQDGSLRLLQRLPGLHLPVDIFFRSLAQVQGGRAIGIVLSGNAADGSAGIRAIKAECGITFAQDESSARFSGMPRAAISTGSVDFVLPPADIGRELARIARNPYLVPPTPGVLEILPEGDGDLRKIFTMLEATSKVDFTHYKLTTVRRRISRRMMVHRLQSVSDYVALMQERPEEVRELYRDLLISVTRFFREAESFDALAAVLRAALPGRSSEEAFRVWVPGCATGEEVYSIAILLEEVTEELQLHLPIQIFGTDISESALDRARSGIYTDIITHDVTPERLRRRFTKVDSGYQISKTLREVCIFARQDITRDPPFSHLDLISCRNLLIYMDSSLQRRVLSVFHYSLKPKGLLILGSAETTAATSDLFSVVDKDHRIFSRRDVPVRMPIEMRTPRPLTAAGENAAPAPVPGMDLARRVDRLIQSCYTPDAVVVDSDFQIVQFRGHTSTYLDPSPGEATLNLLRMTRESLVMPLRRLLHEARSRNAPAIERDAVIEHRGERRRIGIEVAPVPGSSAGEQYFLVIFRESHAQEQPGVSGDGAADASAAAGEIARLERELADAHDYLRALTEDHEASSEELRASNEEVRSANEELQSTNEELSTTKEELQSANEELTTVNEELHIRNSELRASNSDLNNLLAAVNIPILMIDEDLRLRRFTTAAEKLLELAPIDIGRPLRHLGLFNLPDVEKIARTVIETLTVHQEEVQDRNGTWYGLAVRPYRTTDNRINGAVITLQDIDPLKRSLTLAEQARDYAEAMIETVREPLLVLDADLRVERATPAFYETFQVTREETEGRFLYDLGNGQWNRPRLRELLGNALYRGEPFQEYEVVHNFPHLEMRTMRLNGRPLPRPPGEPRAILVAIEDLTEPLQHAEMRYRRMFETAKDGMAIIDAETRKAIDVNPYFLELTGCSRDEVVGQPVAQVRAFQPVDVFLRLVEEAIDNEVAHYDDVPVITRQNSRRIVEIVANRYLQGGQTIIQVNARDVTQRKKSEVALRESEERFRLLVDSVRDHALFQTDLQGRVVNWTAGAERLLGYRAEEIVGRDTAIVFTPEDVEKGEPEKEMTTARKEGRAEDERWHVRKDGSRFFASGVLTQVRDGAGRLLGFAKVMRDVTARQQMHEELERSLHEKEVLLKEVHHRVKNNLQVITSLLNLQAQRITDPVLRDVLAETEARVRSLGTIHEFVYRSATVSNIDFGDYIDRLIQDLAVFHDVDASRIKIQVEAEHAMLDLTDAVPAGLIVNELLTNCLKHAFPGNRKGTVRVTFSCSDTDCLLEVADNGIGFPADIDPEKAGTTGLELIYLLAEQLHGEVSLSREKGTVFAVRFPRAGQSSGA